MRPTFRATWLAGLCLSSLLGAQTLAGPSGSSVTHTTRLPSGLLSRLAGSFPTHGATPTARARSFLDEHGAGFGVNADTTLRPLPAALRAEGVVIRFQQFVHGFRLQGHGLVVQMGRDGNVLLAHGTIDRQAATAPRPRLSAAQATARALSAASLQADELATEPVTRPLVRRTATGYELVWRVEVILGLLPIALEIDARTGALLRTQENAYHTGNFHLDDQVSEFATSKGKGLSFGSVKKALSRNFKGTALKQVSTEDIDPGVAPLGSLTGRFAQVVDADGLQIISPTLDFPFQPLSPALVGGQVLEYQLFDHVNTYVWLTRMGTYFAARLGSFNADYSVLSFVNFDDEGAGYVNAFYTTADIDGAGGYDPGYFVFGEFTNLTGDPMDDLSRDPTVVCHEYAHLVVDKQGVAFGDNPLDTPPRAVNEGLADYAAASYLNTPHIGQVFVKYAGELNIGGSELRTLDSTTTLTDDLFDFLGVSTLLPEEHWAGSIFGAALWRARASVKPKQMDALVYGSLDAWPVSTAEVGFPVVSQANALAAYRAFYAACYQAVVGSAEDSLKGRRLVARVLGAFMTHGILGAPGAQVGSLDATEGGLAVSIKGAFLGSLDTHQLDISLAAGQTLSIAFKGAKGTQVDYAFDDTPGDGGLPGDFSFSKPKQMNAKGTKAGQKGIQVNSSRTYRLTLSNTDSLGGAYKLVLRVK